MRETGAVANLDPTCDFARMSIQQLYCRGMGDVIPERRGAVRRLRAGFRPPGLSPPMRPLKYLLPPVLALLLCAFGRAANIGAARPPPATAARTALPTLSAEQRRAIGIAVAAAPRAELPQRIAAYGRVLDPAKLVADEGRLDSARAAARAAAAESARLAGLYRGANTSLKALQTAEAMGTQARVNVRQAQAQFLLSWGPLARLGAARRARLIARFAAGRRLLLRADLPGRHSLGALPQAALVDVDGIEVPARVLGPVPQAAAPLQSVGLLLEMSHPPEGLGPGAQLPVMLKGSDLEGRLVPNGAVLYGPRGSYVYHALPGGSPGADRTFAPLSVTLLQPVGNGWLVAGLHADDRIVVRGAAALWSMQGLGRLARDND
jgi:hypothetical protein